MKRPELLIIALFLALVVVLVIYETGQREAPASPEPVQETTTTLPDFASYKNVSRKKEAFFEYLLPMVRNANARVMAQRERLEKISDGFGNGDALDGEDRAFITELATRYRVNEPHEINRQLLDQLLLRVDVVPASLILAQAANESAWGTSRFAKQANNLFGIWCFTPGCGVTPRYRDEGLTHEVRRFDTVQDGVHFYLRTINSNSAYRELRAIRASLRSAGQEMTGAVLAEGLLRYSERGEAYVEEIQAMIRINQLRAYNIAYTSAESGSG